MKAPSTTTRARRALVAVALMFGSTVAAAALTTAGADVASGGAQLVVTPTELPAEGGTVTVNGSGYDPAGAIGTRPPFAGQPSGVYVVVGRFADTWQPSAGAPSSARQVITQVWALPQAQYEVLNPSGPMPRSPCCARTGPSRCRSP